MKRFLKLRFVPPNALASLMTSLLAGMATLSVLSRATLPIRIVAAWDVLATTDLVLAWWTILSSGPEETRRRAKAEELGRIPMLVLVLTGSAFALGYAIYLLRRTALELHRADPTLFLLCLAAVVLSWLLTHTTYSLHYARLVVRSGGIQFRGDTEPDYLDFAYFAFTVGMCYQISDVPLVGSKLRHTVLAHAILSYGYGTAVFALMVNVVHGMW
jgi:uncharacterized membrane protein